MTMPHLMNCEHQPEGRCPACEALFPSNQPMSNTAEKSLEELQIDDGELLMQKHKLSQEKQAIQGELAGINARTKHKLPNKEFFKLKALRSNLAVQLSEKEREIGAINHARAELNTIINVRKRQAGMFPPYQVRQLVEMRDKYHEMSMDPKKHKEARNTAWNISQELRAFLKPFFTYTADHPTT